MCISLLWETFGQFSTKIRLIEARQDKIIQPETGQKSEAFSASKESRNPNCSSMTLNYQRPPILLSRKDHPGAHEIYPIRPSVEQSRDPFEPVLRPEACISSAP